jgi:GNAT superfamily N-acetyltransferase
VARLTVAPDLRGRGVGRALLAAVHAAAPPSVTRFWLVTEAGSEDDLRLYAAARVPRRGHCGGPRGGRPGRLERPAVTVGGRS